MFVEENVLVEVVIFYKRSGYQYRAYDSKKFEELELTEEEKSKYKKLTLKMKQLTWGLYNDLQEGAVDHDNEGNRRFNYRKYKEMRLIKLIQSWDATQTQGDKIVNIPVNEKNIKMLSPEIAEMILTVYDSVMYLTDEDEGK